MDDETHPCPRLLSVFGIGAQICVVIGIVASGLVSVLAIVLVGFFNSIILYRAPDLLSLRNLLRRAWIPARCGVGRCRTWSGNWGQMTLTSKLNSQWNFPPTKFSPIALPEKSQPYAPLPCW